MKRKIIFRLVLLTLLVVGIASFVALPPAREFLKSALVTLLETVRGLGVWGVVLILAAYIVAGVLAIPGLILSWGSGFVFGPWLGTAVASIGNTLGAAAAFLVGRTLARGIIERQFAHDARFRAIDHAIAKDAFKVVLLVRLAPVIPFNVMSYVFAVTRVRFRDYFFASLIGMFPATAVNVYVGSLLGSLAEMGSLPAEAAGVKRAFFFAGLLATVVATGYVTHLARTALKRAVPDVSEPEA